MHELGDALRLLEVLEAVRAQVAQRHAGRQRVPHQLGRGPGEHHLPPVGRGHQAGAAVQRRPEVVGPLHLHLPQVDAHPGPERAQRAPVLPLEGELPLEGRPDGVGGAGERRVHRVPHRLEDHAPVGLDGLPQEVVVAAHGAPVRLRVRVEEPGAPLHVREQE